MAEEQTVDDTLQKEKLVETNKALGLPLDYDPVASLNSSSSFYPIPKGFAIKEQVTGNALTGPNPGLKQREPSKQDIAGALDSSKFIQANLDKIDQVAYTNQNPFKQMREYSFNGDHDGANFERYYSHPKFKQLGFTPYRNNEELYNKHSTFGNELSRAAGQWGNLVWTGFKSGLSSFGDMFGGDPLSPDLKSAEAMNRAMAIGSSSKGGATGFFVNTFLNSGYSIGVGLEMLTEELALIALTALTVGSVAPATLPAMGAVAAKGAYKIWNAFKTGNKALNQYRKLNTVTDLKSFWNNNVLGRTLSATGRVINPLSHTMGVLKGVNYTKDGSAALRSIYNFGEFARDFRDIKGAVTESKLEAGLVQIETTEKLIDQYKINNDGREPEGKELEKIHSLAKEEAYTTAYWNMPIIMMSNKFMYEGIFAKLKAAKPKFGDAAIDASGAYTVFEKEGFKAYNATLVNKAKLAGKALISPRKYGKFLGTYFKGNVAEGLQENMQETVSGAAIDHALSTYNAKEKGGYDTFMGHLFNNASKQFSMQGLETFSSGLLMGAITQPVMSAPAWTGSQIWNNTVNKGDYKAYKAQRFDQLTKTAEYLNKMYKDTGKYFASEMRNTVVQGKLLEDMYGASENGDLKTAKDAQDLTRTEALYTALRTGNYDTLVDKFKDFKNFDDTAIEEAFGLEKGQGAKGRNMLDSFIARAEKVKTRFDYVNKNLANPYNIGLYKKGSEHYNAISIAHQGWEEMKRHLVFGWATYDRNNQRIEDMVQAMSTGSKPLSKVSAIELTKLMDPSFLNQELDLLDKEIETFTTLNAPESKNTLEQKKLKRELLHKFQEGMLFSEKVYDEDEYQKLKTSIETGGFTITKTHPEREDNGNYIPGTSVHILQDDTWAKVVSSTSSEYTLDNGKKVSRNQVEALTDSYIKNLAATDSNEQAREAYKKYIHHLAGEHQDFVFNEKLEESFQLLLDFRAKNKENVNLVKYINYLNDPRAMLIHATRVSKVLGIAIKEQEKSNIDGISHTVKLFEFNRGIKALAEDGWFVNQDDLIKLTTAVLSGEKELPVPTSFINTTTGKEFKVGTPEYEKGLAIWNKHVPAIVEDFKTEFEERAKAKLNAKHTVVDNADGTFTILNPDGEIVGQSFTTKEEAETYKDSLNLEAQEKQEEFINPEGFVDIDTMTYEDYPQGLQDLLKPVYEKFMVDNGEIELEEWLQTDSAITIINNWNNTLLAQQEIADKGAPILQEASTKEQKAALAKVKALQDKIGNKEVTIEDYIINGEHYQRATKVVADLMLSAYKHKRSQQTDYGVGQTIVTVANEVIKNQGTVQEFIDKIKTLYQVLPKFNERKFKLLADFLDKNGFTEENVVIATNEVLIEHTGTRGDNIDKTVREFFNTGKLGPKPKYFTQEAYDDLKLVLDSIKDKLTAEGYVVVADDLTIWDENAKVAGTLDLLLIDKQGNYIIYDIKTGSEKKWEGYQIKEDNLPNSASMTENTFQLSIYKNILENQTGIRVSGLAILPIAITEDLDGNILTVKPGKGTLEKPESIKLEYNSHTEQKIPLTKDQIVNTPIIKKDTESVDQSALEDIERTNTKLGKSILEKAGYKNENRLPNGNVKGGQAGWKIRFNIKNPKTGESYYDGKGTATLVDNEYNKRAETLINFLLDYFGSNEKADSENLQKHYILEDKDGIKREPFKHLTGGEIGESDFTIYIGSADDVLKFVSDIRNKHPEILELLHKGNSSEDVDIDNIFKGRIEGSKIGFSGYHVPTNLNKVIGSKDFIFTHNGKRIEISYEGNSLTDIYVYSEETGNLYKGVFDKNMKNDLPELYKNIRNIIGFQLYGKYLTGSNNEFVKGKEIEQTFPVSKGVGEVGSAELTALEAPQITIETVSLQQAKDKINSVSDLQSLDKVKAELLVLASQGKLESSLEVSNFINQRQQELLRNPVAASLKKGDRVLIDGVQHIVTRIGKKEINVRPMLGKKITKINIEDVSKTIDQIIDPNIPIETVVTELPVTDQIAVKQTLENSKEIEKQDLANAILIGKQKYTKGDEYSDYKKKKC